MREVQASCSLDLDLSQAGRAREGGGGPSVFYFLCLLCLWFLYSMAWGLLRRDYFKSFPLDLTRPYRSERRSPASSSPALARALRAALNLGCNL